MTRGSALTTEGKPAAVLARGEGNLEPVQRKEMVIGCSLETS